MANLKTHNPVDVAIAEAGRQAQGTVQWLLEKKTCPGAPEITQGNQLDFFICGQEGFGQLARDLLNAKETADIICWGFDPGMELVRSGNRWQRGQTYGELLEQLARKGVRVRLLIWYDGLASIKQNNMPGFTDAQAGPLASPYDSGSRMGYCQAWWKKHLPRGSSGSASDPNLQIVLRQVKKADVEALMNTYKNEEYPLESHWYDPADEASLLYTWPTHHQKPVLIDYSYQGGSQAVGYVMGLNSVTDFWDTTDHFIDTGLREAATSSTRGDEINHEYESDIGPTGLFQSEANKIQQIHGGSYKSIRPYQDYACQIKGPALSRLHQNFEKGWNASAPQKWQSTSSDTPPQPVAPSNPDYRVQIVRTQAHEREKTIKSLYFQSTSFARNYIYIENQYFFYPEFARHLKAERENFCDKWARLAKKPMMQVPTLHMFIVIPHPEDDGMIPRTFDTLTELGASNQMPGQAGYVDAGKTDQVYGNSVTGTWTDEVMVDDGWGGVSTVPVKRTHKILDRPSVTQLQSQLGLKVSVARLCTSGAVGGKMAYREIYIHSKLMIIDDVFLTLGSANLNQRSMSADSEINIGATGSKWATDLRRNVFNLHSGNRISGDGGREAMPDVFKNWDKLMNTNYKKWKSGKDKLSGFLVKFEDMRKTDTRHASITVPSSDNSTAFV